MDVRIGRQCWVPKNWCFWTVVLEKGLESPLTARRSNQSVLKEISSEYSLEVWKTLKLKLQYFGHLMRRTDSLEKTPILGKIEGRRRRGWQRIRWLMASLSRSTWVWVSREAWCASVRGIAKNWIWLSNWTDLILHYVSSSPGNWRKLSLSEISPPSRVELGFCAVCFSGIMHFPFPSIYCINSGCLFITLDSKLHEGRNLSIFSLLSSWSVRETQWLYLKKFFLLKYS